MTHLGQVEFLLSRDINLEKLVFFFFSQGRKAEIQKQDSDGWKGHDIRR